MKNFTVSIYACAATVQLKTRQRTKVKTNHYKSITGNINTCRLIQKSQSSISISRSKLINRWCQ